MRNLIIITGISVCGKTALSHYICNRYENSTFISMDTLKEDIYDIFINLLEECMRRNDKNIVIEYPFNKNWQPKFEKLVKQYDYKAITIKIKRKDFNELFKKLEMRNNSEKRQPSHALSCYHLAKKDSYKSINELDYETLKSIYETNKYTLISVGKEFGKEYSLINDNFDYRELINEIDSVLND